jgi:hypothetical protein
MVPFVKAAPACAPFSSTLKGLSRKNQDRLKVFARAGHYKPTMSCTMRFPTQTKKLRRKTVKKITLAIAILTAAATASFADGYGTSATSCGFTHSDADCKPVGSNTDSGNR